MIKNLNDIRKLKPSTLKKPTKKELLESLKQPYKQPTTNIIITSEKGAELLKKSIYGKNVLRNA